MLQDASSVLKKALLTRRLKAATVHSFPEPTQFTLSTPLVTCVFSRFSLLTIFLNNCLSLNRKNKSCLHHQHYIQVLESPTERRAFSGAPGGHPLKHCLHRVSNRVLEAVKSREKWESYHAKFEEPDQSATVF